MLHRVIHFLRPTFIALIAFALTASVVNVTWLAPGEPVELAGGLSASDLENINLSRVALPSDRLSPDEVVRLQLAGLGDERSDGVGILQCYALASPGNRVVTGPLDRFGAMVRQGPFQCLARPVTLLIGRPQVDRGTARVLVTVMDQDSRIHAFTFVLTRQQDPPFRDCWMTEAVLPSLPVATPQRPVAEPTA